MTLDVPMASSGRGRPKPGNLGLSGAGLSVGYVSTSVDFDDFPAPCMWPINNGDEGQIGVIAVASPSSDSTREQCSVLGPQQGRSVRGQIELYRRRR